MSNWQSICSMCGGASTPQPNFQKQVDPPIRSYGTILGDDPAEKCRNRNNSFGGGMGPTMKICLPTIQTPPQSTPAGSCSGQPEAVVHVPTDPQRPCRKIMCESQPPRAPTKVWLIKSSPVPQKVGISQLLLFFLSFAIAQPPACIPLGEQPIIIPCQRPC